MSLIGQIQKPTPSGTSGFQDALSANIYGETVIQRKKNVNRKKNKIARASRRVMRKKSNKYRTKKH